MSFACAPNPGRVVLDVRYAVNTKEAAVVVTSLPGYVAGLTDVNIIVPAGVWLWSDDVTKPGLSINATGASTQDRVRLVNRGAIIGRGGNGGSIVQDGNSQFPIPPTAGGPALRITAGSVEIDNTGGTIAGGGGGGGCAAWDVFGEGAAGGGGAGGGIGGSATGINSIDGATSATGGAGGAVGSSGAAGSTTSGNLFYCGGAGGGRVLPGTTGAGGLYAPSLASFFPPAAASAGGGGGASGNNTNTFLRSRQAGGGGGGWGSAGGTGYYMPTPQNFDASAQAAGGAGAGTGAGGNGAISGGVTAGAAFQAGAAGGKAIELVSGGARTLTFAGTTYGATS